ncbi:CapA family protein [Desulfobacter sp. UBA2225]|uniref:CapA family protein n=1 Tax=Desulfobacter sp. UBA2225 TaxID=1961413 RepID=UPI00257F58F5|nr:CapA family protein [Desulfobacter sp. UBA2225]
MVEILIGGDFCPIGINEPFFEQPERVREIFPELCQVIAGADLSVFNLECPLTDNSRPIRKSGPNLRAKEGCMAGIRALGITTLNLANNHIMDFGETGLARTLDLCQEYQIASFGVGRNRACSLNFHIVNIGGKRVAILGVAEHEWSIATARSWGAAPLDLVDIMTVHKNNRSLFDFSIIIVHGGMEHYPYPTPRMQKLFRFLSQECADVVVCQHTHCAGCYEVYKGKPIFYGQGNFLFDYGTAARFSEWNKGFLIRLIIQDDNTCQFEIIPHQQGSGCPGVRVMQGLEREEFVAAVNRRSQDVVDALFVETQWLQFCAKDKNLFVNRFRNYNKMMRRIVSRISVDRLFYMKDWVCPTLNSYRCETLSEYYETTLGLVMRDLNGGV